MKLMEDHSWGSDSYGSRFFMALNRGLWELHRAAWAAANDCSCRESPKLPPSREANSS